MSTLLKNSGRKSIEVAVVLGVFVLFFAVGMYSGQTTMSVEMIDPPDGSQFQSSPVELVARVTVKGVPVADAKARFTIRFGKVGETSTDTTTDFNGIARLVVPAASGNYTWHVAAIREGYPTIVSRSGRFSIRLSLLVYPLLPSLFRLSVSPVDFKARVTEMNGHLVGSANVTFYVDLRMIGSSLTAANGIAGLSSAVDPGMHTWFASATKNGEGGVSDSTVFIVGELSSLGTGDLHLLRTELSGLSGNGAARGVMGLWSSRYSGGRPSTIRDKRVSPLRCETAGIYLEPTRMSSSSALNEYATCDRKM